MNRIALVAGATLIAASTHFSSTAQAQGAWPNKPMRWIIPYAAGGGTDVIARPISIKLSEVLGQPILYDNRGGGGGLIGAEFVARSAPDGYTFLVAAGNTHVFATLLNDKISYDPVKDYQAITQFDTTPNVLVSNPNFPPKNMQELIAYARANPGKVNWGHSGTGAGGHLSILQLM
jgi:tripartite-type tricarboxylate transporter receptor subunit TctC